MSKSKAWISAMRLRTLPLSISGILVGSMTAKIDGHWNLWVFISALTTTLLFQILSNLANDFGDSKKGTDNENRLGPTRAVQSGLISLNEMKFAVILTAILSLISAATLIYLSSKNWNFTTVLFYTFLAMACVLAAITYTVGKRAYGYHGLGDVFVFLFFGVVSVLGVYPLYANQLNLQTIFAACSIGFFSTAVLNLNNMRDQINDAIMNKRTLVVKLGNEKAKMYHAFLILGGLVCWLIFITSLNKPFLYISFLPTILFVKHLVQVFKTTESKQLDAQLKPVALSTFFMSLLFSIGAFLS